MSKHRLFVLISACLTLVGIALYSGKATAQSPTPTPAGPGSNDACLACHSKPGMQTTLPTGETIYLSVDPATYEQSVHGSKGYACTQCHTNITGYPHPAITAANLRRFIQEINQQACSQCHQNIFEAKTNDAHTLAREQGILQAPVCSDCHGSHDITPPDQPRSRIPQTCAKCHSQIFDKYKDSVHGEALIGEGNPDVPSCIDCHNAHNIQGPDNTQFRLFSPQICARCHANQQLMDKYGINTNVFNSYISDFHGTTVEMFQAVAPGQETNKPVCIDCHGVHDIKSTGDPNSTVIKENILKTCQKCHPGATTNFPAAWLSHFPPSPQHSPVVYYTNMFYRFFIPGVLGIMAVFVVTDASRRIVNRTRRKEKHQ